MRSYFDGEFRGDFDGVFSADRTENFNAKPSVGVFECPEGEWITVGGGVGGVACRDARGTLQTVT